MARYRRPRALSQRRDPTEPFGGESSARGLNHENHNCTATSAAMALDAASNGLLRKRGGDMRHKLPNPSTGENPGVELSLGDAKTAMARFGYTLWVAGYPNASPTTWAAMKQRRAEGRLLIVQGDSGDLHGACSEGQDTGHAVVIHPDDGVSGYWLVGDPWCYTTGTNGLGKWKWVDRDDVWDFAQDLGFLFAYTKRLARIA